MAKKKYKSKSWYKAKLLDIAKKFAKERDENICQKTGDYVVGRNAHGSHVVPVSSGMSLMFDLNNIICLSSYQHIYWWHKDPLAANKWFKETFPKYYKYLEGHRNDGWSPSTPELAELYEKASKAKTWKQYKKLYESCRYGTSITR